MTRLDIPDVDSTSLSNLSEHDWAVLSNRWARGASWNISKLGRNWQIVSLPNNGSFPLFKTKTAACDAFDTLILMESRCRGRKRTGERR